MEEIKIIYEDNDILVIDKPAGLLVHGVDFPRTVLKKSSRTVLNESTLVDWLVEKYPEIKNIGDSPDLRPGIVHRLDKDTSGVLLVAKNQKTFEYLKKQFMEREVTKKYIALVQGDVKLPTGRQRGIITSDIGKSKSDFRKKTTVGKMIGETREAITVYEATERFGDFTLLNVYPKTGRTHQIRVHLKSIGHPVVCDRLYGPKKMVCPFGQNRHFLHAFSVEFIALGGSKTNFEADLPEDLENVLKMLRKHR